MRTAAAAAWMLTAMGGLLLAFQWITAGGLRQDRALEDAAVRGGAQYPLAEERRRQHHGLSSTLVFTHGGLALLGLFTWLAYAVPGENDAAASIGALFLLPVVALGIEMFRRWLRDGKDDAVVGPEVQEPPADRHLSPALVYIHGISAILTIVLVVAVVVAVA